MRIPPAAIMMIYFRAKNCANAEAWVMFRCGPTLPHTGPASFFIRAQTLWIPLTRAHTNTQTHKHRTVVGVPASRAGPPDNGGSLFIYPSMRADTTDRLPFIGKSFLIPQMSGALNRRGHRVSLRPRATRAIELRPRSTLEGREGGWVDGSKRISDVSLDNRGDRLYFVYTREPRGDLVDDILLDRERIPRIRSRDTGARVEVW